MTRTGQAVDVLVAAPMAEELRGLLRRVEALEAVDSGATSVRRARLGEQSVVAAVVGDGAARATRALERLLHEFRPQRMLLLGIAGAVSVDLDLYALVEVEELVDFTGPEPRWVVGLPGSGAPTAVSVSRVLTSASEKTEVRRRLASPPHCVVDLESAAAVELTRSFGAGWGVLRAVSDRSGENLPSELATASDGDGHVARARLLALSALRPWRLGRLLTLRRRLSRCSELLGAAAIDWIVQGRGYS